MPGKDGRDGQVGRDGRDGIIGPRGSPGYQGHPGYPGHKGEVGEQGMTGARGPKGEVGDIAMVTGPPGLPGQSGKQGPKGNNGSQGLRGQDGPPGTPSTPTGGVTYTRWGVSSCRNGSSTLYAGRAGGTHITQSGGASNYLCMPNVPQYTLPYRSGVQGYSYVYGVEYEHTLVANRRHHNAPCAVCYVSDKMTFVMIPAITDCPTGWTREYYGYLMSGHQGHKRSKFVCVDKVMESVPGRENLDIGNGAHIYHVEVNCAGMACPPYNSEKELNCVVCTK